METWNETDEWADRYVRGDLSGEDRVALIKWLEASPEHLRQFRNFKRKCGYRLRENGGG